MSSRSIVTLTVSPALDKSSTVSRIVPENKLRCEKPKFEAGGGGINVAKAIKRLGGNPIAVMTAGGPTGKRLQSLVKNEGVQLEVIETKEWTRENFNVTESSTGFQYRFSMPAADLMPTEIDALLDAIQDMSPTPAYLIASGSLPAGMPVDFYGRLSEIAKEKGIKFVLDTSGEPLRRAMETGVYMLKPNMLELSQLVGADKLEMDQLDDAAQALIIRGNCEVVVVSLGAMGAILVTKDQVEHVPAPPIQVKSSVGAGDSMVAGMVWSLANGKSLIDSVKMGVACGSAATMNEGSELFRNSDVEHILDWLKRYGQRYNNDWD